MSKLIILALLFTIRFFYHPTETNSSIGEIVSPAAFQAPASSTLKNSLFNRAVPILTNRVWLDEEEGTILWVNRDNRNNSDRKI